MTLNQTTQEKIYEKVRAYDGVEVAGHESVDASIASVLSEGEVLADDGNQYSSIQDAVDASTGWTFVGPGTYYENVHIDKDDFMLQGAGNGTFIDGGTTGHAIDASNQSNVTISSVRVENSGNDKNYGVHISGTTSCLVEGVNVTKTAYTGIRSFQGASDNIIRNCRVNVTSADSQAIGFELRTIISNCIVDGSSSSGNADLIGDVGDPDDSIIANCVVLNSTRDGIRTDGDDCIIIGNRIHNSGDNGIDLRGLDNIIANNRVSGSTNADISNSGTGTVTDANITGLAN